MARPAEVVEDTTPLDGARIDVGRRIGWLLRVTRLAHGMSLGETARLVSAAGPRSSPSRLSLVETGSVRNGQVVDAYEQVLGVETGRLRAAVDVLCRTFPYAPADQAPELARPSDLATFDAAVEPVLAGGAGASEWFSFVREHASGSGYGLPSALMRPLVDTLVDEMGRSVGRAFVLRYEALSRLRCGPYADVVEQSVRDLVADPASQVLLDAMSAVAERPTVRLLEWAGGLLRHESDAVSHGAVLALQNMCTVDGLSAAEWHTLAEPFLAAYATADATRRTRLTQLFKTLPPQLRQTVRRGLSARLEPVRAPAAWTASRRNRHFALAADAAAEACAAVGVPSQPMAGRLLFELLYDFRSTRVTTSAYLLMASPLAGALLPLLVRLAGDDRDPTTRDGAANAAMAVQDVSDRPDVGGWVDGDVPGLVTCGLVMSAHAGLPLPEATLRRLLADPATTRLALYAAGMVAHPLLGSLTADPAVPAGTRAGAAWWLARGPRMTR